MSWYLTIPCVHPVTLVVAVTALMVSEQWLPGEWRWWWRWLVAFLVSAGAVAGGLAVGMPWRGEIRVTAYAGFLLAGFAAAWWLIHRRMSQVPLEGDVLRKLVLVALVAGVVGARAWYVQERWSTLRAEHGAAIWWVALDLDRGGAVWYGGLLLGTIGVIVMARWHRISLLPLADVVAPATLVGLGIGRLGCWANGCCYGHITDLPWGIPSPVAPQILVHPTQAYEALAATTTGWLIWWRGRAWVGRGLVASLCLGWYGCWRFVNEGWRGDHDVWVYWPVVGRLTSSQGISILLVCGSVVLACVAWWRGRDRRL